MSERKNAPQHVRRYYATENGGLLEWDAADNATPPADVVTELTEDEYRQRLATWEAERRQRQDAVRLAERTQADHDVAALVQAGIAEDIARRMANHPDARYAGAPAPDGED